MPKYTGIRVFGYWLYYTPECLKEGIVHVHANRPTTQRKGLTKLWVYSDGSSTLAGPTTINSKDLMGIQNWIKENIDFIEKVWKSSGFEYTFKQK